MEFRSVTPISQLGAGYGQTAEIIKVDSLRLMHVGINHGKKEAQFVFAWGGYGTGGQWFMVPEITLNPGQVNLTHRVPGEKEIWEAALQDGNGNSVTAHDEAIVDVMLTHGQLAKMVNGAWVIPNLELQYGGVTVGYSDAKGLFKMGIQKPVAPEPPKA